MKRAPFSISTLFLAISLFFTSCNDDSMLPIHDNQVENVNSDDRETNPELQMPMPGGGLLFADSTEYAQFPMVDVSSLRPIGDQEAISARSTTKVLNMPPVASQGNEGSCTAFSAGYGIVSYFVNLNSNVPYDQQGALRSPEFLYNSTREPGPCDEAGAYLSKVLNFLKSTGVPSWSQMPYSSTNGCSLKPNATQNSQAVNGKIASWSTVANKLADVKALIDKGYPILMAFDVRNSTLKQINFAPYIFKKCDGDKVLGGHAVVIVGYDNAKKHFIIQNSWGTWNNDDGFFYVHYDAFPKLARELYCLTPVKPATISVENATNLPDAIQLKVNNVTATLAKGKTTTFKMLAKYNDLDVQDCLSEAGCVWLDHNPLPGEKYRVVIQNNKLTILKV